MIQRLSLLDLLALQMKCTYLSDLRFLNDVQRWPLARVLESYVSLDEDVQEWNDALEYLSGQPPEETAIGAKTALIKALQQGIRPDEIFVLREEVQ